MRPFKRVVLSLAQTKAPMERREALNTVPPADDPDEHAPAPIDLSPVSTRAGSVGRTDEGG